eukprot:gene4071-2920_t
MPPVTDEEVQDATSALESFLATHRTRDWSVEQLERLEGHFMQLLQGAMQSAARSRKRGRQDNDNADVDEATDAKIAELDKLLARIRAFLKRKLPFGSLQEPTLPPGKGTGSDDPPVGEPKAPAQITPIYSVDAFLYLEEDIDELVTEGAISREYCKCCGSTDIGLTEFITHSFNQDQLIYLTCFLFPALVKKGLEAPAGKQFCCRSILDVGSRLGVVLWATYFAAKCGLLCEGIEEIIGVEMDESFFQIQQEVGTRFCSRQIPLPGKNKDGKAPGTLSCRVVGSDCFKGEGAKHMHTADVVILHNVFEYFSDGPSGHLECWERVRSIVNRPGQLLVCFPSLEETFEGLEQKGAFESKGKSKESTVMKWIESYVDPIDVTDVAERFFSYRQGVAFPSNCEGCDHGSEHSCHSCDEEIPELLELVRNIFVYRVK